MQWAALSGMTLLLISGQLASWPPSISQAVEPPAVLPNCPPGKELCLQAERSGGIDLKTGIAYLEGNVVGRVRSRNLSFSGHILRAYREKDESWVRLVLERNVRLTQNGRHTSSDQGVVEQGRILLSGDVSIEQEQLSIQGHEAILSTRPDRITVKGWPNRPLRITLAGNLIPGEDYGGDARKSSGETVLQANLAILAMGEGKIELTGNVHIEQSDEKLRIQGERVLLLFDDQSTLLSFTVEGDVVIGQPGRVITADFAQSRAGLRSILLVGRAAVRQKGAFDLKADRLEIFTDARKGMMQSEDRQNPITLTMDLDGGKAYRLQRSGMISLSGQDLPPAVLEKLAPLLERKFDSRAAFMEAAERLLDAEESELYLDTVANAAQG